MPLANIYARAALAAHLHRWTNVALRRHSGAQVTADADRLYVAALVRETEGLLKLVLTRPARVTVPGETHASERTALAIGGVITVTGRDANIDGAAHLQFATAAEAKAFAAAAGEPTTVAIEGDLQGVILG